MTNLIFIGILEKRILNKNLKKSLNSTKGKKPPIPSEIRKGGELVSLECQRDI
jgi:hypothetical protein